MQPGNGDLDTMLRDGESALRRGQWDIAIQIGNRLAERSPDNPYVWNLLSVANLRAGDSSAAINCIERALKTWPRQLEFHLQLAHCWMAEGNLTKATSVLAQAEKLNPNSAALWDALGATYSHCEEHASALSCFEKATEIDSENPNFLFNLATAQRMAGKLSAAEATCDRVIAANPDDYRAFFMRANLRQYSPKHNHISEMTGMVEKGIGDWRGEVLVRYALAKECEDTGDFEQSFAHLAAGAKQQRQHMRYRVEDDVAVIERIIESHTRVRLRIGGGEKSTAPIFVLGLPRTGTTLVERILSSHSEVVSMGELNTFALELQKAVREGAAGAIVPRLEAVEKALSLNMNNLGGAYLESASPQIEGASRFVDKMPLNFLYCGLIHAALPNAKIIHLTRHAMDACYAIYKTYFTGAYPFSYDLNDLGKYYVAYSRLMEHWRTVLGDTILDVSYEALVADQEHETRRILNFCELDWQDACLRFHENEAPATTASAAQVRNPIYKSSIGRWRQYDKQLRPLAVYLSDEGIRF